MTRLLKVVLLSLIAALSALGLGQVLSFANGAQHRSLYSTAAQPLNRIKWSTSINDNVSGGFAHYAAPLVTASNTVIVTVRNTDNSYDLVALNGTSGAIKYRLSTGYTQPTGVGWLIPVQPVLVTGTGGTKLYYPGAGGTIWKLDNPDSDTPAAATRIAFMGTSAYNSNTAGFNSALSVNTPLTADSAGNIYYGIRTSGTAPAPLSTTASFIVKITAAGATSFVDTATLTADSSIQRINHGCAPALSENEQRLYLAVKGTTSTTSPHLISIDTASLSLVRKTLLKDPRNGNNASMTDFSTASPMVAPDGDVYLGVMANPSNGSRGWLLRFNGDLTTEKMAGGFGWDYTPAIIPASMVPSYTGTSTYLIYCKYNNYNISDGNGVNTVCVLDPNETQVDFHTSASGLVQMRQVLTQIGPSPDPEYPSRLGAVREWCINAAAVSEPNRSIYFNSEDGSLYRWDLTTNSLTEAVTLNSGIGQPYVPTIIGPDGTLYTLNGGYVYAVGGYDNVGVKLVSSKPSPHDVVNGESVTFTATVTGAGGTPTGTVTFEDTTVESYVRVTRTLGTATLDGNGVATLTATLGGGAPVLNDHWGNHRIKATYNGDTTYPSGVATLSQKIHAFGSTTTWSGGTFAYPNPVSFSATVAPVGSTSQVPSGYVWFSNAAGKSLAQLPVSGSPATTSGVSILKPGQYSVNAKYQSDSFFATSSSTATVLVTETTATTLSLPARGGFGEPVTLSATVAPTHNDAGTPIGSVSFFEGSTLLGTAPVDSSGVASTQTTWLVVGNHTVTAVFNGDPGWLTSTSASAVIPISATTLIEARSNPTTSTFGSPVELIATVSAVVPSAGIPSGIVTFLEGLSTQLGTATLNSSGVGTLTISNLTVGTHLLSAFFNGGDFWDQTIPIMFEHTVTAPTAVNLTSSLNPSVYGNQVTFTATISAPDGAGTPTGSVSFKNGDAVIGTASVANGVATVTVNNLLRGDRSISAVFTGTGGYLNSSTSITQTVNAPTQTTVTSSINPSAIDQETTITATVQATGGASGVPTGSVTFDDGITTRTIAIDVTGKASYSTAAYPIGTRTITATFTGTNNWIGSSGTLSQSIIPDTVAPNPPTGVRTVSGPARGQVRVIWNAAVDPNSAVARYDIYRASSSNGTYTKIGTTTGLIYVDNPGRNQRRWYYVKAIDIHGNVSAQSAIVVGVGR